MALNFSHRPVFAAHLSEDSLVSPIRIANGCIVEGVSENCADGFDRTWISEEGVKDCFDCGRARCDGGNCSQESVSADILDRLPSDPFGMDISTTVTAITGWLEDLEINCGGYGIDLGSTSDEDYQVFAGLNFIWNNAMRFQSFPGTGGFNCNSGRPGCVNGSYRVERNGHGSGFGLMNQFAGRPDATEARHQSSLEFSSTSRFQGYSEDAKAKNIPCDGEFALAQGFGGSSEVMEVAMTSHCVGFEAASGYDQCPQEMDDVNIPCHLPLGSFSGFGGSSMENGVSGVSYDISDYFDGSSGSSGISNHTSRNSGDAAKSCSGGDAEMPHYAFCLALSYLSLQDLLTVESVCKSLCSTVRSDPFSWRNIHIEHPLNDKVTDEVLLRLTDRAQGNLQCLSLVECTKITDEGLKRVLESNPKLSKLCVPGCTRLSINGLLDSLRTMQLMGTLQIKHIRIGGLYGVTEQHFEELKFLLGVGSQKLQNQKAHKPHFYHRWSMYLSCEDDRVIDVETCPRCQKLRLVYDCPAEVCQGKQQETQVCRACTLCIPRCGQCGLCIDDNEYEETFCLECLCSDCSRRQLPKRRETHGRDAASSESNGGLEEPHGPSICG